MTTVAMGLSPRHREVMTLLRLGFDNKQVAGALGISPHTVHFHVARILRKLGAVNRTHAVALFTEMMVREEVVHG